MTTRTYTSVFDHSSDAGFRAWGSEFASNLASVGMVQTADTGQINWSTVTSSAPNTAAGYEIWHTSDSSLYFKFEYGTGSGASYPMMWVTVGTGSNGSGTLTGQTCTRGTFFVAGTAAFSTSTAYTTYMSASADHFALTYKIGAFAGSYPFGFLTVGKSVASSGAVSSVGYGVLSLSNTWTIALQSVRTAATAATYARQTSMYAAVPGLPTSSLDGADIQAYLIWLNLPRALPFAWSAFFLQAELVPYNTVSCALVGTTTRTYLVLGQLVAGDVMIGLNASTYSLLMIWE